MSLTLDDLRRFAVARSLFPPTTLERALDTAWLRAGGSDPGAGARAGPHAAASRRGLSRRRSRATLRRARRRGGLLRQLRLRDARGARADASARQVRHRGPSRGAARRGDPGLRARARRGPPARGRRALRPRHGHELLGRLVERDDAPARRRCTTAACCASCGATPASASTARSDRCSRRSTRAGRARASRRAGRRRRAQVRAAAGSEPRGYLVRRLRYGVPQWRARAASRRCSARSSGCRTRASTASTGTGRPDENDRRRTAPPDDGASAGAVRSGRLGSAALRDALGLGVPVRGVHAGEEAHARLLRAAAALARPGHRLGQHRR